MVVAEAVDLLNQLNDSKPRTAILRLIRHDSPYVVGAVLRYMARQYPHEAVSILHKALASKEPIVRQNAIDELDDLNCKEALPAIKRLLRDPDKHVRQAARSAVKNLDSA
jgi:vesicle coat complex subunit